MKNIFFYRGMGVQAKNIAAQPVGFAAGVKAAEERIQMVLKDPKLKIPLPVVAVENFLLEVGEDKYVFLMIILLIAHNLIFFFKVVRSRSPHS